MGILSFTFNKFDWKILPAKWRPFSLGFNILKQAVRDCFQLQATVPSLWSQTVTRYKVDRAPWSHVDGLVQERCNSIANALELRISCTNPSIWNPKVPVTQEIEGGMPFHKLHVDIFWGNGKQTSIELSSVTLLKKFDKVSAEQTHIWSELNFSTRPK